MSEFSAPPPSHVTRHILGRITGSPHAWNAGPTRTTDAGRTGIPRWTIIATLALVAASIAISIVAALTRGPWMDEFWTLWATDPTVPWPQALRQRWLTDVHPPLFSMASRLLSGLLGPDIPVRRLQNLLPLAALLAAFAYAARTWTAAGRFLLIYAVLTFSSYFMAGYFAEYRSYFAQFCCGVVFYGCGYALLSGTTIPTGRGRAVATMALLLTSLLLVNLHFVTAVVALISLAGLAMLALHLGQRRLAASFCAIAAVSAAPLAITLLFQARLLLARTGGHFWIETGLSQAVVIVAGSIIKGIGCNLVIVGAAMLMLLRRPSPRLEAGGPASTDRLIGMAFLAVAAIACCALLVINLQTPIIIDRYLVLCSAAVACGLAILARDVVFESRIGVPLLLANAVLFLAVSGGKLFHEPRWNASATLIRTALVQCPTATVEAFQFIYPGTLPDEWTVLHLAYDYLGQRFGFQPHLAGSSSPYVPAARGARCADILWTEHVLWSHRTVADDDRLVLNAARLALGPIDLADAAVLRTRTGAVVMKSAGR